MADVPVPATAALTAEPEPGQIAFNSFDACCAANLKIYPAPAIHPMLNINSLAVSKEISRPLKEAISDTRTAWRIIRT